MKLIAIKNLGERGSALIPVILAAGLIGVVSLVVPDAIRSSTRFVSNSRDIIEMRLISEDLKELGKYLVLSEKIFFLDKTFEMDSRMKTIHSIWGQPMGAEIYDGDNIGAACGAYNTRLSFIGTGRVQKKKVFCPSFVRSPAISSLMLQEIFFRKWDKTDQVELDPGNFFRIDLDLTETILKKKDTFIDLGLARSILEKKKDMEMSMGIRLSFHLDNTGFTDGGSRRFVTSKGWVRFKNENREYELSEIESFSFETPTIKEFAIFNVWPTTSDEKTRTRRWSQSMQIAPSAKIYGKVFFNGDIDVPLDRLPTFYQTVVISGRFRNAPGYADLALLQQKFRKGLVTNFSAERFLLDGKCTNSSTEVVNGSELNCLDGDGRPMTMRSYIDANLEWGPIGQHDIRLRHDRIERCTCARDKDHPSCNKSGTALEACGKPRGASFVFDGGASRIDIGVARPFVALSTPASSIRVNQGNIYGTMMTGHLQVGHNTEIYSVSSLAPGLPGIPNQAFRDTELNPAFSRAYKGIGVPVPAFVMVTQAKDGFK